MNLSDFWTFELSVFSSQILRQIPGKSCVDTGWWMPSTKRQCRHWTPLDSPIRVFSRDLPPLMRVLVFEIFDAPLFCIVFFWGNSKVFFIFHCMVSWQSESDNDQCFLVAPKPFYPRTLRVFFTGKRTFEHPLHWGKKSRSPDKENFEAC